MKTTILMYSKYSCSFSTIMKLLFLSDQTYYLHLSYFQITWRALTRYKSTIFLYCHNFPCSIVSRILLLRSTDISCPVFAAWWCGPWMWSRKCVYTHRLTCLYFSQTCLAMASGRCFRLAQSWEYADSALPRVFVMIFNWDRELGCIARTASVRADTANRSQITFADIIPGIQRLSFFLSFWRPNLITGSGWQAPN